MSKFTRNLMHRRQREEGGRSSLQDELDARTEAEKQAWSDRWRATEFVPSLEGGATMTGSMPNPSYDPDHAKRYWAEQEVRKAEEAKEHSEVDFSTWPSLEG